MTSAAGVRTERIGAAEFAASQFRPEWDALAARAAEPNPFFEPALLEPAIRHLPALARASVLLVWRNDALIGLLPLVPRPVRRLEGHFGGRVAFGATTNIHPHCYFANPLLAADDLTAAVDGLLDGIDRHVPMGLLWLEAFDGDGAFARALQARCTQRGQDSHVVVREERPLLQPHADGSDAYLAAALDRKALRDLERRRRGLAGLGTLEQRTLEGGDETAFVDAFLALEASGWKGEARTALACTAPDAAFLRDMARALHAAGRLRAQALVLDGRWIAVAMDLVAGEGCFAFKTAFDESLRRYSPGKLLEVDIIHALHGPGAPAWIDSCTDPANALLGKLWTGRRTIEHRIVAARNVVSRQLLRWVSKRGTGPAPVAELPGGLTQHPV